MHFMETKESQKQPNKLIEEALNIVHNVHLKLFGPNYYMINMDQTPIFLTMHGKVTLN